MAKIVRLTPRRPSAESVVALATQLRQLEGASSPDFATMDAITAAEQRVLAALAKAVASGLAEVAEKLDAVARRAVEAEGMLADGELELLRSALQDLRRIAPETAVA